MDVVPSGRMFAQRQFTVRASQPRVWDLLATVIYQELPLEQVDIVSLDRFRALLTWRAGFIHLPLYVEGKLVDTLRPESYGCVLSVRRGPIQMGVKVAMRLKALDQDRTEVLCSATLEGKERLMGLVLGGLRRSFALKMFDSIAARLEWLCS